MHFYFEMRIGFLFLFLERGMKNVISKIPSGRFWIMPNDFFEKYKLNSRVYGLLFFAFYFCIFDA